MRIAYLLPLALLACSSSSATEDDDATSTESAVTGVSSYSAEARIEVAGEPVRIVRAKLSFTSNVVSSKVEASHVTSYDEGSFRHDSCTTAIEFPAAKASVEVIDEATGAVLSSYVKPIAIGAGFDSPTNEWSTCSPHGYPSLSQDSSIGVAADPITYPDGKKTDQISMPFDVHVEATHEGAQWRLTSVTLDPYAYANLNHSAFYHLPSGGLGFASIYATGKYSVHTVKARADVADCSLTDSYASRGDAQPVKFHYAFDVTKKLEPNARVFVKYAPHLANVSGDTWSDTQQFELTRSGNQWTGELVLSGQGHVVKGYPNTAARETMPETGSPSALLYVFRTVHADGTEEWENGSIAKWGNYRTTGGYYAFTFPASCDGLGRTTTLGVELDAHR